MKKATPVKEIYTIAKRKALKRILKCSGVEQALSGIYDRTYQSGFGSRDEAHVERKIRDEMGLEFQYRTIEEPCHESENTLSCRILLMGSLERDRFGGRFSILSYGMGREGTYQEGSSVRIQFSLKRKAYVYLFDVDEEGRGVLLFPGPLSGEIDNPLPSSSPIAFPPESTPAVRLVASLPAGMNIKYGHIWILAFESHEFIDKKEFRKMGSDPGDLPHVKNFQESIMTRFRKSIRGGAWSLRVIPYRVVGKKPHQDQNR